MLLCPSDEELRFIGEYPIDNNRGSYRLYGRRDCTGCPVKIRCTKAKGRRVKIPTAPPIEAKTSAPPQEQEEDSAPSSNQDKDRKGDEQTEPTASLTEPEAAWMLATSRKRWEPCFNADIAVTQTGIIISQFLTNDSTDYHHFAPALAFVTATLGKPESWVGDGHYGTEANLVLADREEVVLYAPRAGMPKKSAAPAPDSPQRQQPNKKERDKQRFDRWDFRPHPDQDALLCPADAELRFIGEYPMGNRRGTYRLYGRRNCGGCPLKERCTRGRGRRVRVSGAPKTLLSETTVAPEDEDAPNAQGDEIAQLLKAHEARMQERGDELMKLRGYASEAANAHLKQHGLYRFHVRGMARCGTMLTLACIAHNLMKWAKRAATQRMKLVA